MKTNWMVVVTSINSVKSETFNTDLTYNEARKMAKEYNEGQVMYHYEAKKAVSK